MAEKKSDFMTKENVNKYIDAGKWPNARAHEGCEFIEEVITGNDLRSSLKTMFERFRARRVFEEAVKQRKRIESK